MILTHLVLLKFFAGAGQAAEVEEGQLSGGTANWYWLDKKRRDAFLKAKKTRQEAEEAALARASEKVRESLRETLAPEVLAPAERLERGLTDRPSGCPPASRDPYKFARMTNCCCWLPFSRCPDGQSQAG
jgi:hypothetical protein